MQILLIMLIVVLLAFTVLLLALAKQSPREKQTEDKEQEEYIRDYAETVRQTGGSMKKLEHWKVIAIYLIIYDIIAVNFSYFMALLVRFDFRYSSIPTDYFAAWRSFAPIYTIIILAVFGCMHLYNSVWRFASLTSMSRKEYESVWRKFDSTMFDFKLDIFQKKIDNFCYAGVWTLYVDLGTGASKPCYGQLSNQNIFNNPEQPIIFNPVGKHCRQPYCYNGHAFLTLGVIPELETPTYADIRNRVCEDGREWLSKEVKDAFSQKLADNNEVWDEEKKNSYERKYPFIFFKTALYDWKEIYNKVIRKHKK